MEDIYETCARLQAMGYTINRPPRDGHMAFVRSPDLISIELLQDGHLPPMEPWASMPNTGVWYVRWRGFGVVSTEFPPRPREESRQQ